MYSFPLINAIFRSLDINVDTPRPVSPNSPPLHFDNDNAAKAIQQVEAIVHATAVPVKHESIQPGRSANHIAAVNHTAATSHNSPARPSSFPPVSPRTMRRPQHSLATPTTPQSPRRPALNPRHLSPVSTSSSTGGAFAHVRRTEPSQRKGISIRGSSTASLPRSRTTPSSRSAMTASDIWALRAVLAGPDPSPQVVANSFRWGEVSLSTQEDETWTGEEARSDHEAIDNDEDEMLFARLAAWQQTLVDNNQEFIKRLNERDAELAEARWLLNEARQDGHKKGEEIHHLRQILKSANAQLQASEKEGVRLANTLKEAENVEKLAHDLMRVVKCQKCLRRHVSHCPCCPRVTRYLPPMHTRSPSGSIRSTRSAGRKARASDSNGKKLRSFRLGRKDRLTAQGLFPSTNAGDVDMAEGLGDGVHGVPVTEHQVPALEVIDASMEAPADFRPGMDNNHLHPYREPLPSRPGSPDPFFTTDDDEFAENEDDDGISSGEEVDPALLNSLAHVDLRDRAQEQAMEWEMQQAGVEPEQRLQAPLDPATFELGPATQSAMEPVAVAPHELPAQGGFGWDLTDHERVSWTAWSSTTQTMSPSSLRGVMKLRAALQAQPPQSQMPLLDQDAAFAAHQQLEKHPRELDTRQEPERAAEQQMELLALQRYVAEHFEIQAEQDQAQEHLAQEDDADLPDYEETFAAEADQLLNDLYEDIFGHQELDPFEGAFVDNADDALNDPNEMVDNGVLPQADASHLDGLTAKWAEILGRARENKEDKKTIVDAARNGDPNAQEALVHLALPFDRPNERDGFAFVALRALVRECDLLGEAVVTMGRRAAIGGDRYPVEALNEMSRQGHAVATELLAQVAGPAEPVVPRTPPRIRPPTTSVRPPSTREVKNDTLVSGIVNRFQAQINGPPVDFGCAPIAPHTGVPDEDDQGGPNHGRLSESSRSESETRMPQFSPSGRKIAPLRRSRR
ncbi:hypothetical protein CspHIS471_0601510 [Cutaneotrichosporon sp. HIS471]|nr:hypothetical protein CspHIS471_0601510 [Cutaneotrichosporon sp. HIS471]